MAWKIVLSLSARLLCACAFILMATPKIKDPSWLSDMSVVWLPTSVAWLLGNVLPWLELSLGLGLLLPSLWKSFARLSAVLLVLFMPVLIIFLLEGRSDCGCAGPGSLLPSWASSPVAGLARNSVMLSILWLALWLSRVKMVYPSKK